MLARLLKGLVKGLILGVALGCGLHFGLHWTHGNLVFGYLVSMAGASAAGVLAGKPPWQRDASLESILKAVVGLGAGALFYYLVSQFASFKLGLAQLAIPNGTKWTEVPLFLAIGSATFFSLFVELDNTNPPPPKPPAKKNARALDVEDAEVISVTANIRKNLSGRS